MYQKRWWPTHHPLDEDPCVFLSGLEHSAVDSMLHPQTSPGHILALFLNVSAYAFVGSGRNGSKGKGQCFSKPGTIFRLMSLVYMQDSCTFGMLADMKTFGGFSLAVNTELLQMSLDVPVADVPVADPMIQSVTLFLEESCQFIRTYCFYHSLSTRN